MAAEAKPNLPSSQGKRNGNGSVKDAPPTFATMGNDLVTIKCEGESRKVYKDLICFYSPYFRHAFYGGFEESRTLSTSVTADLKILAYFLDWLHFRPLPNYSEEYCRQYNESDPDCKGDSDERRATIDVWYNVDTALIKLYVFADRYNVPRVRHDIMKIIYDFMPLHEYWNAYEGRELRIIATSLPEKSPLYRFAVEITARSGDSDELLEDDDAGKDIPAEFLRAVLRRTKALHKAGSTQFPTFDDFSEDKGTAQDHLCESLRQVRLTASQSVLADEQ